MAQGIYRTLFLNNQIPVYINAYSFLFPTAAARRQPLQNCFQLPLRADRNHPVRSLSGIPVCPHRLCCHLFPGNKPFPAAIPPHYQYLFFQSGHCHPAQFIELFQGIEDILICGNTDFIHTKSAVSQPGQLLSYVVLRNRLPLGLFHQSSNSPGLNPFPLHGKLRRLSNPEYRSHSDRKLPPMVYVFLTDIL